MRKAMSKMMKRGLGASGAVAVLAVMLATACSQNTIAALVTTLGNACSGAAALAGNAQLSRTILADSAKASQQVLAWKSGSAAENVVQVLHDLQADLSEIPETASVAPFIDLGIATIDGILTDITGQVPAATQSMRWASVRSVRHPRYSGEPPRTAKAFNAAWDKLVNEHPQFAGLRR
jgi:hypothetical protein